jgi:hypothetical protein
MSTVLEKIFEDRLAHNPYCSDDLDYGLYIRNKAIAGTKKYIQANQPAMLTWLCFDIDYPCVLETTFREKSLPAPNLMIVNPKNNHSHLLYGLLAPICKSDNARKAPLNYLAAIEYSLREELEADQGYSGLIVKNPLNKKWNTYEIEKDLWNLESLSEYLTLPKVLPKKAKMIGLGRNCTLFELGRLYAYKEVLLYRIKGNQDLFFNAVLNYLKNENEKFPQQLLFSEYKAIAKSISKWTWCNYTGRMSDDKWFSYVKETHGSKIQSTRGKKGGKANSSESQSLKGKKSGEIRFKNSNEQLQPWKELGISRRTYYYQKKNKFE